MAYAGSNVNKDSKITAAVASNIWGAYEKGGKMAFNNEGLRVMFMDCEVCLLFNVFSLFLHIFLIPKYSAVDKNFENTPILGKEFK